MRYVAAYLLALLGGNKNPSAKDIEKILGSVGIEAESEKLKKVIGELSGKDVAGIMEEGKGKLASMPSGGAVAVSAAAPAIGGGGGEPAKEESKKAEKEESEESDEDMGFGLFD